MRTIVRFIDSISEWTGRLTHRLYAVLVLFMVTAVIMRYVLGASTLWAYEVSLILGATIYVLSWAYIHKYSAHVRVDIFYYRLSPRKRAFIDVVGFLLFFAPLMLLLTSVSVNWAWHAWAINERMHETGWLPPAAPLRSAVACGICLFALQGLAQFIRDLHLLIRSKPL